MPSRAESMAPEVLGALLVDRDPGRLEEALVSPDIADADRSALRGELARRQGDYASAAALLDEALVQRPAVRALHHAAALAYAASGNRAQARSRWQALLARAPDDAIARFQVAVTYDDDGDLDEAARWYEAQVAHTPGMSGAWLNLGRVRRALGDAQRAIDAWDRAHAVQPGDSRPLVLSAALAGERADLPDAIARLSRAIAIAPSHAGAQFARAAHRSSLALHAEALSDFREAIALDPANAAGHSALLIELHYDESLVSPDEMLPAHEAWAARHAVQPNAVPVVRSRGTRLRVGYLSPRFGDVPLAALLLPVLEARDCSRFEIVAYAAYPAQGAGADRVRGNVDRWCDLPANDDEAAALVADDPPDLLVDLAGHAPGNRLPLLARRLAPVQATWLDYFDTTGVPAIDFLIGDAVQTPAAHASRFRERLVLLPHARFAYRPPVPIMPRKRSARRGVTFGSFNRLAKVTDEVIDTWAAILRLVPGATLVLRASAYRSAQTVSFVRERWRARGVPVERIVFHPFVSLEAMHAGYDEIDVALDTFPFNGGLTTCDALAHGVPLVTLEGDRMIARQGCALLSAARRSKWIARHRDDYVAIAAGLADSGVREIERAALRDEFVHTPLCGIDAFTRALETAFASMVDERPGSRAPMIIGEA